MFKKTTQKTIHQISRHLPVWTIALIIFSFSLFPRKGLTQIFVDSLADLSPQPATETLFEIREELNYKVYYGFILLGYVDVLGFRDTTQHGRDAIYYRSEMRSNPDLFFIGDKFEIFHSISARNDTTIFGLKYWSDDLDSDIMNELLYIADSTYTTVAFFKEGESAGKMHIEEPSLLGPDIYQYSRLFAGLDTTVRPPMYVAEDKFNIMLDFNDEITYREYDAFPEPIPTFRMKGKAPFEGPFGFSGEFEAWYGTDSLRIPLEAHAKVWIGSVKVRLVDYKRYD